jgi:hypothetical protein
VAAIAPSDGTQRQLGVHPEHRRDHADEHEQASDEREEGGDDDVLQQAHVVHDANHQIARTRPVMEREGEKLDLAEQLSADRGEGAVSGLGEADGIPVSGQSSQRDQSDQREGRAGQKRRRR